jgi:hypothetical protein
MLISMLLITVFAFGGLALTYLVNVDERFMWRLSVGVIAGSAVYGLALFLLSMLIGLNGNVSAAAVVLAAAPILLLTRQPFRGRFKSDWNRAKGKFQGGNAKRFAGFGYYAFFLAVFWLFFNQSMYETAQGIFTGGSNNLGDLPFHLGAIFGFTDGNNFPPQNPSFAGAKFSYPFMADLIIAGFMKLSAGVKEAMFVQNVSWAFALVVIVEKFTTRLTGSKLAGRLAPFLLVFSGGLGFFGFFLDYWAQGKSFFEFLWATPRDYTISTTYRWGNSMVVLFMTQRSLLLGMPLTVTVLGYLWRVFDAENRAHAEAGEETKPAAGYLGLAKPLMVGLLAGTLPLIHLHSLGVLFVVTAFLLVFRPAAWKTWIAFGIGVCVIALPELAWTMSGTASETSKFIGWHFGWDKRDENVAWFWIKNTGLVLPAIAAGAYLISSNFAAKPGTPKAKVESPPSRRLLMFYIPFLAIFLVSNIAKLAPWEWDNIKLLIYWFVGSLPLIAYAIAWAWRKGSVLTFAAGAVFAVLIAAGGLDVFRTITGQNKIQVFDADAVRVAEQIKQRTPPNALFLNAPTYNSAVVLSGRPSFMRYSGHLASHGIDYGEREDQVKRIYSGAGVSDLLLSTNGIEYVLVSPEERNSLKAADATFAKYPVVAESGQYRVYKIK